MVETILVIEMDVRNVYVSKRNVLQYVNIEHVKRYDMYVYCPDVCRYMWTLKSPWNYSILAIKNKLYICM